MTAQQSLPRASQPTADVKLAPWGWYTRHMLTIYARHIAIVVAALMSIALTTDIAIWVWREISTQPGTEWWLLALRIGWIVVLRALDLLPQITPIAFFLGVLWAETTHTWSGERQVIWSTGRSPSQCVIPVLLIALSMTFVQFVLDAVLRPASVIALENRNIYGAPDPQAGREKNFLIAGDDLVQARVGTGTPPQLYDVTIYRMTGNGRLRQIITAATATPASGSAVWTLSKVGVWNLPDGVATAPTSPNGVRSATQASFETMEVTLALAPSWLTAYGIHPQYLPYGLLRTLATLDNAPYPIARYQVWFYGRFARSLLPGAMALIAATLAIWLLAYRVRLGAVFAIAAIGYVTHVLTKIATAFGEHEVLNPIFAIWSVPLLLLLVSGILLAWMEWKQHYRFATARPARSIDAHVRRLVRRLSALRSRLSLKRDPKPGPHA